MPSSNEDCMVLIENDQIHPVTAGLTYCESDFFQKRTKSPFTSCSLTFIAASNVTDRSTYDDDIDKIGDNDVIRLRYLCATDVEAVKLLCKELFPVEYPDFWYKIIMSDPSFWPMAAIHNNRIIGLCIAEIKRMNHCNFDDRDILSKKFPANTPVCYVLSLGVDKSWRRKGVASLLLDQLLAYVCSTSAFGLKSPIRDLYLHVLITNKEAISFYERRKFRRHAIHLGYYNINGKLHDGYVYVFYLNGGHAALSFSDTVVTCGAMFVKPLKIVWNFLRKLICR